MKATTFSTLAAAVLASLSSCTPSNSTAPTFANDNPVTIHGFDEDIMEPFVSRDGSYMFFNSLNDGETTSLYYASRETPIDWNFEGEVMGANGAEPHLDAVASMDDAGKFYWITNRDYPLNYENVLTANFNSGEVSNVQRLEGDIYIEEEGWMVMDAEVSPNGNMLYYASARFDGGSTPVESDLGIAVLEGGKAVKHSKSDIWLKHVNTEDALEYAPCISSSGLELYFTRMKDNQTDIMVAVRNRADQRFSRPVSLGVYGEAAEAASLTSDANVLYYHKQVGGVYRIYCLERQ